MRRGEVWWALLPKPDGRRPVVLLSRDSCYGVRMAATVAVITRTIREIPVEVPLDAADGLPARCVVNADNLLTVPLEILGHRICSLSDAKMRAVEGAIRFALDLA